jgi:hypothetical protein
VLVVDDNGGIVELVGDILSPAYIVQKAYSVGFHGCPVWVSFWYLRHYGKT